MSQGWYKIREYQQKGTEMIIAICFIVSIYFVVKYWRNY